MGIRPRPGRELLRPEGEGLHGPRVVRPEAVPEVRHESVRRRRHPEPERPDERREEVPRPRPGPSRFARHRDLRGDRVRGHGKEHEVLPRERLELRPDAPDDHRPRGAEAVRTRGHHARLHGVQRGRRFELRAVDQVSTFQAGEILAKTEGLIPAPETCHAIRGAIDLALEAKARNEATTIAFNYSGHGLLDLEGYRQFMEGTLKNNGK